MRSVLCFLLLVSAACMRAPEPPSVSSGNAPQATMPSTGGAPSAPAAGDDGHEHAGGSQIHFALTEDWKESDREVMFAVAVWDHPSGGGGTLSIVGGGVDANIQRWAGQFEVPGGDSQSALVVEDLDGCNFPTKLATIEGTLTATKMVGGGPAREGWMLIGAAVSGYAPGATNAIYLKIAGPADVMKAELEAIKDSLRQLEYHG